MNLAISLAVVNQPLAGEKGGKGIDAVPSAADLSARSQTKACRKLQGNGKVTSFGLPIRF